MIFRPKREAGLHVPKVRPKTKPVNEGVAALKRAQRRLDRRNILSRASLEQLEAGVPIVYKFDGEFIEEHPDGGRFVVRLVEGGRSSVKLREL